MNEKFLEVSVQESSVAQCEEIVKKLDEANLEIERLRLIVQEQSLLTEASVIYGVRIMDRETEKDPHLGVVMYSSGGDGGPWHDMVIGHPDWCWEVYEALNFVLYSKMEKRKEEENWLRQEFGL
jgi:hypothetical protein